MSDEMMEKNYQSDMKAKYCLRELKDSLREFQNSDGVRRASPTTRALIEDLLKKVDDDVDHITAVWN